MRGREIRTLLWACAVPLALFAAGCSGAKTEETTQTAATDTAATAAPTTTAVTVDQAREAGTIAHEVEAEPSRAAEILQQHGLTAEQFEARVFEIARDPELTKAYEETRHGGSTG